METVVTPKHILKTVNNAFNERIKEIMSGSNQNYRSLELGKPCAILIKVGLPDLPIQMSVKRLVDKKLQLNHPFSLVSVVHMPEFLADPIAVFQSKTRGDCKVVLTDMQEKGVNFVVAIQMEKLKGDVDVNDVRSVYPKDNVKDVLRWIAEDGLMEYCNKEKILDWFGKQQSISAEVTKLIGDCTKIIQ